MTKSDSAPRLTKKERFDKRRIEILRGAARAFARLGYHGASLNDLGAESEMTPAALYYYVRSKDEMLYQCGKLALTQLQAALVESRTGDRCGAERLRAFFREYARFMEDDFGRCFVLTLPDDLPLEMAEANIEGRRELDRAVREMIDEGIADGSITKRSSRILADVLFATFNAIARRPVGYRKIPAAQLADAYLDIVLGVPGPA